MKLLRKPVLITGIALTFAVTAVAVFSNGNANAGAGERTQGAVAIPAGALAYASVSLDRSGASFDALEALAGTVQGGEAAVQKLNAMLDGSTEQAKVVAALGGNVSVGLVGVDITGVAAGDMPQASAIIVATAADGAALPAVLTQAGYRPGPAIGGRPVWEQESMVVTVDGSTAIGATSRATLAEALAVQAGEEPSLADNLAFTTTVAKLPGNALAVAYIAPAQFAGLLQTAGALLPEATTSTDMPNAAPLLAQLGDQLQDVRGLGIAITAEQGGLRVIAAGDADPAALAKLGLQLPTAYTPGITAQVPANAVGFVAFRDLGPKLAAGLTAAVTRNPQLQELVATVEETSGVTLEGLAAALGGEHVLFAQGGPTRGAALLTQPQDAKSANAVLSNALVAAQELAKSLPDALPKATQDAVKSAQGSQPRVGLTQSGSLLAIGTLPTAATTPSASIAASEAYRAILGRAGVPADVTGLAYLNAATLRAEAQAKGMKVPASTNAINGVVAWGTADGAELFISIG